MRYTLRPATRADATLIAPLLRDEDKREVLLSTGLPVETWLPLRYGPPGHVSLYAEETGTGRPLMITGTVPIIRERVGAVWMLATPAALDHRRALVRDARSQIERWHAQYPLLCNRVWAGNATHISWLRAMGFSLVRCVEHNHQPFIEFARHIECATSG